MEIANPRMKIPILSQILAAIFRWFTLMVPTRLTYRPELTASGHWGPTSKLNVRTNWLGPIRRWRKPVSVVGGSKKRQQWTKELAKGSALEILLRESCLDGSDLTTQDISVRQLSISDNVHRPPE